MAAEPSTGIDLSTVVAWTFAIIGVVSTLYGWRVRGEQQKWLAKKKDTHESIDRAIKALIDFEDSALTFWLDKDTKLSHHHILALHRRLIVSCKQVTELSEKALPSQFLVDLRKYATLDFEEARRPISAKSQRIANISLASGRLLNSSYLTKSWSTSA